MTNVAIRITSNHRGGKTVIAVFGALKARHVGALERECGGAARPLVLDLEGLRSADSAGAEVLRRLGDRGAEVINASPYVRILLQDAERCRSTPEREGS